MSKLTEEQQRAVDLEGGNILVSAGAGSGKTSVLSKRVLRKVKDGFHVERLLLLTFTKDAAKEMKDRVRKVLIENKLDEEAKKVDEAYITTFDSFSLSMLKKYHYALNIPKDIKVCDETLLSIIKSKSLDKALDLEYKENKEDFSNLITNMSLKGDDNFKKNILDISNKLDLMYDRNDYLDNYIERFYKDDKLNEYKEEYVNLVLNLFDKLKLAYENILGELDGKKLSNMQDAFSSINDIKTYDEISAFIANLNMPRSNGYSDIAKEYNSEIKSLRDMIKDLIDKYPNTKYMIDDMKKVKSDTACLIRILKNMYKDYDSIKKENNYYDFSDISIMIINLLNQNEEIKNEVSSSFDEIMVDEYQDTSDIEEELLNLISNNNLYMVGDIKQSIYRFRNANPNIFREKYKKYKDGIGGTKIDLNKNFRSRKEVLDDINLLFDHIMDEKIGGANYKIDGEAKAGNKVYDEYTDNDYNVDILTYEEDKDKKFSNSEKEIFLIANDIKEKVESHKKIFDKDKEIYRPIKYSDIVVLLSKKKKFDLYKKIFEYLNIPITIYREERIDGTDTFYVLHSLCKFVLDISKNKFDENTKYAYLSLARSFLFNYSDTKIFEIFKGDSFKETDIYQKALSIKNDVNLLDPVNLYLRILDTYNFNDKILTETDIDEKEKASYYFYDLIKDLESKGYGNDEIYEYLDNVKENGYKITYNKELGNQDSVKIMSIHKSKGLEYPICYFGELEDKGANSESKEKIVFDRKYGFMLPVFNYGYKYLITRILYNRKEKLEDVGEKIRLFYVALTRSREKMIIVMKKPKEESSFNELVPNSIRETYSNFYNMVSSISGDLSKYVKEKDINNLSKDYINTINNEELEKDGKKIEVKKILVNDEKEESKHFSKEKKEEKNKELLEFGTLCHKVLEEIDFKNSDFSLFDMNDFMKNKIKKFLESDIINKIKDGNIYKEYEFINEKDNIKYHGIIDLMIEYGDEIYIFDYKLKNIDDENYDIQLNGYKDYIKEKTNKNVHAYLYSLIDSIFREII